MKNLLVALMVVLSTGAMAQQKLGHVNSQVLLDTMPSRKIAIQTLGEFEKEGIDELKAMEADLQEAYLKLEATAGDLTPIVLQIEKEKLQKKEQNYNERKQTLQREIQAISQSLNEPIVERMQKAIKIVADRKKINYVFDEATTLFFDTGIDLTAEIAKELLRIDAEAMSK